MHTAYYREQIEKSDAQLRRLRTRYNRLSLLRAGTALAALVFFLAGLEWNGWAGFSLCAAAAAGFIVLMRLHDGVERSQRLEEARRAAAKAYLDREGEGWKSFSETGEGYQEAGFPAGQDLDIFGRESLYQYLCAAHTVFGKDTLARWLKKGESDCGVLRARQEAVEELAGKAAFSLEVQAYGRMTAPAQARQDAAAAADFMAAVRRTEKPSPAWKVLMWGMPLCLLALAGSAFLGFYPAQSGGAAVCLLVVQLALALVRFGAAGRVLEPVIRFRAGMAACAPLLKLLSEESFESARLCVLRREAGGAVKALCALERLGEAVGMRRNIAAFLLFNGLFLWDFHCAARFVNWREAYREKLPVWLEAIGELEALLSLAVLRQLRPDAAFPVLEESEEPQLSFKGLSHPLLPASRAIGNDFHLENRTCIITGSNMSGKTTFLRSIGVALVLAYAGGPVPAKQFRTAPMRLLTSIRTQDSVSQGISSFYAELLRIKAMVDAAREPEPLLVLIDEIYKGTNSQDRIQGAVETIRRLSAPHVRILVTTHDFALCDLENDAAADAVNCHFAERYTDTEIVFDYILRPGRCRTTNARQLLRLVGILEEKEGGAGPGGTEGSMP